MGVSDEPTNQDDLLAEKILMTNICWDSQANRYEVPLLWKVRKKTRTLSAIEEQCFQKSNQQWECLIENTTLVSVPPIGARTLFSAERCKRLTF
uniref:Uncharacterized protein n=1 Tax=Acrobeloides nanus TaxID=290746 RepID=A0A914DE05_9BILA